MNRCRIEKDTIYFQPFDGEEIEVCGIEEINIVDGQFVYGSQCYPLENKFNSEKEVLDRWNEIYPNGKVEEIISTPRIISDEEKINDFMKVISLTIMNSDELLTQFGITPNPEKQSTTT